VSTTQQSIGSEMSFNICFYFLRITYLNWSPWHAVHSCNCNRKWTKTAQRHDQRCNVVVTVELCTSAHKGRNSTSWEKLGALINVGCQVTVNCRLQLNECTAS